MGQSDPAWAEKVCGMAAAKDGSSQIGFGFGKYSNRNVVDAYAGICRGREQWVVRASRALNRDPESVNAGPVLGAGRGAGHPDSPPFRTHRAQFGQ